MVLLTPEDEESLTGLESAVPLLEVACQAILGSRTITRELKGEKKSAFGAELTHYEAFSNDFWNVANEWLEREQENRPQDMFVYIYVESNIGIKRTVLLENWHFIYTPDTRNDNKSATDNFDKPEARQLLRSVISSTRFLPAFYLYKKLSKTPDQYTMKYKIATSPEGFHFNTTVCSHTLPSIESPHGSLTTSISYVEDCMKYSKAIGILNIALDMSYYPSSQMVNQNPVRDPKSLQSKPFAPAAQEIEIEEPEIVKTEEFESYQSCVSHFSNLSQAERSIANGQASIIIDPNYDLELPVPEDVKEFRRLLTGLQSIELLSGQRASFNKSSLEGFIKFAECI